MTGPFDDGKDVGAMRTIGELAAALGIKAHVLRYWESQFPMLQPLKRSGGRRYYRADDVALVREIDRLVNAEGYTLRGAKTALKGFRPPAGEPADTNAPVATEATGDSAGLADSSGNQTVHPDDGPHAPAPRAVADAIARLRAIRADLADAIGA